MATWNDALVAAPDLASRVEKRFAAHKHVLVATLRKDGFPRLSGIETTFALGELWLGMMPGSRKARDLQRDPRLALHSATVDLDLAEGDARITGRAVEITDPETFAALRDLQGDGGHEAPTEYHLFRVDVVELSLVRVMKDRLVIDSWAEGRAPTRVERT